MPDDWAEIPLEDGDRALWQGRPRSKWGAASSSIPMVLLGLAVTSGVLLMLASIVMGRNNNGDRGHVVRPFAWHNVAVALAFGRMYLPWWFRRMMLPIRRWRRADRTRYLPNDRRAIICEMSEEGCEVVREFPLGSLVEPKVVRRPDGSGSLIFGLWEVEWPRVPVGFLDVEDVAEVETLLAKLVPKGSGSKACREELA